MNLMFWFSRMQLPGQVVKKYVATQTLPFMSAERNGLPLRSVSSNSVSGGPTASSGNRLAARRSNSRTCHHLNAPNDATTDDRNRDHVRQNRTGPAAEPA